MAIDPDIHHVTEAMELPHPAFSRVRQVRRAQPTAAIYQLKARARVGADLAGKPDAAKISRGSMFFRGKARTIENDPFLQRLSRLK